MGPISKNVPLIIAIGDTPPDLLVKNDLKVFRCALSFVSTACSRTETGSVRLDICVRDGRLVFECKDSAPAVSASDSANLFKSEQTESMIAPTLAGLHLAAYMLSSMEGEYGFQPYSYDFNDGELLHSGDCRKTGSLFWFSVPIGAQLSNEDVVMSDPPRPGGPVEAATTKIPLFPTSIVGYQQKLVPSLTAEGHDDSLQLNASSSSVSRMSTEIARDRDLPLGACTLDRMGLKSNMKTIPRIVSGTPARQRKALVIDDSLVVRKTLGRALSTMGYECTLAENGMEGLKELQATIFDLSLCDFLMPVMDGLDCVKQYREWERANRPRFRQHIVGISAHASGNDQFVGLKLGLDDFKAKPVAIKTLKELSESKAVSLISQRLDSLALAHALGDTDKTSISSQPSSSIGSEPPVPVCLVASSDFKDSMAKVFESNGWTCAIARDCGSAMKLLKMRNWDAVLLDEGLLPTSASNCAREFRQWEAENRVNRQNNMFMLCSMCETSSDGSVVVQAPWGFDGALSRQMCWNDFETLVQKNSNNIITR
jgi:DNA-binding response OmpR family regulator